MSQASDKQQGPRWAPGRRREALLEVGATFGLTPRAIRRARLQLLVFGPLFAGVILLWEYRGQAFGLPSCNPGGAISRHLQNVYGSSTCPDPAGTKALQIFVVLALLILGWALARDIGRGLGPILFRRMDAGTAGTAGFVTRLLGLIVALVLALRIADVSLTAIAITASASAVVLGLAAQQTLGNLIAGIVLLSVRPFRVGDTVRLQVGVLAGQIEGVVTSLGLMYTTFDSGGDPVLVPNGAVLAAAVRPLHEPEAVTLRARVSDGRTPIELQTAIEDRLTVAIRRHPRVALEEVDETGILVTITVAPQNPGEGGRLASELLEAVTREVGDVAENAAQAERLA
ncbi:MAG TPA: mechanosensitive ion channel family protein [Solirubrobacteraceae bacterium]